MVLVTAIITTHKRSVEIVERALQSVLQQTYSNIEVLVVDDSPNDFIHRDDVKNMVEGYNVKYIQHDKCMGACAARNTGLRVANGEFVAFLDDDDEWKPTKIEKQLDGFTKDCIALVYCGSEKKNDSTGEITCQKLICKSGKVFDDLIKENFIGSTSFPLMRKHALLEIGGFDVMMQSMQDGDVWLRIAQLYEVAFIDEPLVTYHVHDGERISTNFERRINGLERIIEKNKEYLLHHRDARSIRLIKLAPMYAGNKQKGKALSIWVRAVFLAPFKIRRNLKYLYSIIRS